jgi:hypothetical protein
MPMRWMSEVGMIIFFSHRLNTDETRMESAVGAASL